MAPEGSDSAPPARTSASARVGRGGGTSGRTAASTANKGGCLQKRNLWQRKCRHPLARSLETIIGGQPADPPSLTAQLTFGRAKGPRADELRRGAPPAVSPSASEPASAPTRCPEPAARRSGWWRAAASAGGGAPAGRRGGP